MDDRQLRLKDGTRVHARRLVPGDSERLQGGLSMLSEATRIQRFHAGMGRLSAGQLRYLTDVDQQRHLAWGAEDLSRPEDPGIAVVRAIGLDAPGECEFAVTVVDAYPGRGLGALLMGLIALDAHQHGFATMIGRVRLSNEPMLGLLERLGAQQRRTEDGTAELALDVGDLASWPASTTLQRIQDALADWPSAPDEPGQ